MNQVTTPARTQAPQQSTSRGEVAPAKPKATAEFDAQFADVRPQIQAVLPSHIRIEQFERVIMTAINNNPDLWTVGDRRSLFNACVQAANDGLMPDGREGALVIYSTKMKDAHGRDGWVKKVQWMPMVYGIRKRMRNSGQVLSAVAHVVHTNDRFSYVLGDDERIEHEVALDDRGNFRGAYAIIKLANGEVIHEYMSAAEINDVRSISKSANSPAWVKWFGEMARKVVLRRASKSAPMESEVDKMMQREEAAYDTGRIGNERATIMIDQQVENTPPRPTRGDAGHDDPEPDSEAGDLPAHVFIDWEGEAHEFHDAEIFVNALCTKAEEAPTLGAYRALFEDNREAIQAIGSGGLMAQINATRQAVEMDFAAAAAEADQQETDGNDAPDPEAALKGLIKSAQDYADRGTDELRRFWETLTKAQQRDLLPEMGGLKKAAARADAEFDGGQPDPFGDEGDGSGHADDYETVDARQDALV